MCKAKKNIKNELGTLGVKNTSKIKSQMQSLSIREDSFSLIAKNILWPCTRTNLNVYHFCGMKIINIYRKKYLRIS